MDRGGQLMIRSAVCPLEPLVGCPIVERDRTLPIRPLFLRAIGFLAPLAAHGATI